MGSAHLCSFSQMGAILSIYLPLRCLSRHERAGVLTSYERGDANSGVFTLPVMASLGVAMIPLGSCNGRSTENVRVWCGIHAEPMQGVMGVICH